MNNNLKKAGVTLMELAATMLIASLILVTIGTVMFDSHRGWFDSYRKVYGGAANDAAMAQVAFERIVRKASSSKYIITGSDELKVYYYNDWLNSQYPDRYARFYRSTDRPDEFYVEHGTCDEDAEEQQLSTVQLCSTLVDADFRPTNGGIAMKLILDDGRESTAVVTTAILHNE